MFLVFLKIKSFEYSEYDELVSFGIYTDEDLSKGKMFVLKCRKE